MRFVRPVRGNDREALHALGEAAGHGMTTVPKSMDQINHRIDQSMRAFAARGKATADHIFYLALEEDEQIIGTSCIFPALGEKRPFYSYRVSHLASQDQKMNLRSETDILTLVNDFHGYTEIGTLFIHPDHRGSGRGRSLSFARFMLMAVELERFDKNIMAEIRGWSDENEIFPFYEHIAKKFFQLDFVEADRRSAHEHQFIADLMPKYPVYTALLPPEAAEVIGKPHSTSVLAMEMLRGQGFRYTKLVDIFDGGPSVEARINDIQIIRDSHRRKVEMGTPPEDGVTALAATIDLRDFICIQTRMSEKGDTIALTEEEADRMSVKVGEELLVSTVKKRA